MYTAFHQPLLFRRLRLRLIRNALRVMLDNGRLRLATMVFTSLLVAFFTLGASWYGFRQLTINSIPFKGAIVEGLFDMLFFTLGGMLLFSTGIILYASLFTAPEARFLLTTPARADHIFSTKFQAAMAFSSWAFVVLGVPIFVAYGVTAGVPWYFYPLLPVFLLGYVLLPGSVSAVLCLLLVRYLPRNRRQFLMVVGTVAVVLAGVWLIRVGRAANLSITGNRDAIEGLVAQFGLARSTLVPNHWMTRGLMAAARGELAEALLPLAMVWSNGLLLYLVAAWTAKRIYRTGFDRVAGSGRGKKIYRSSILDRIMEGLVIYLDKPTRVLVLKDFRTFRRDPTQWAMLVLFAVLIVLGGANFRQFYGNNLDLVDKFGVSIVNMGGVMTLLCAGLSRFIFPLISLEGRKFWILGLLPIHRGQILTGTFAFAATGSVIAAELLIFTSDLLLAMPLPAMLLHAAAVFIAAVGLSGLNVGLGAAMPNFRETDPSKIVVGFGGTVNMVAGLGFIVAIITIVVLPYHMSAIARLSAYEGSASGPHPILFAGVPVGMVLGALCVWLPLRAGRRALEKMEF